MTTANPGPSPSPAPAGAGEQGSDEPATPQPAPPEQATAEQAPPEQAPPQQATPEPTPPEPTPPESNAPKPPDTSAAGVAVGAASGRTGTDTAVGAGIDGRLLDLLDRPSQPAGAEAALRLAATFVERGSWPGGIISAFGAVIIGTLIFSQESHSSLTVAEFIAALVVGTVITLAGPLVITLTTIAGNNASKTLVESNSRNLEIAEVNRASNVRAVLEYLEQSQGPPPSSTPGT